MQVVKNKRKFHCSCAGGLICAAGKVKEFRTDKRRCRESLAPGSYLKGGRPALTATCCIFIQQDRCHVLRGAVRRGKVRVAKAFSIGNEELEDFLRRDRSGSYLVAGHFKLLFQETLLLPKTDPKLLGRLVGSEVARL